MDIFKKLEKMKQSEKIAVYAVIIVITTLVLVFMKQGTFNLGLTGVSGSLMPFLHHSRWGALMAVVGSWLIFKKPKYKEAGVLMIVVGLFLVVHHLATEQCFALLTGDGLPAGGLC